MAEKLPEATEPASAPELTDEQKQAIEAKLEAEKPTNQSIELRSKPHDVSESEAEPEIVGAEPLEPQGGKLRRIFAGYWRRKMWTLPLTLLVILGVLAGVPATRFGLAGLVVSQQVDVTVLDSATGKPVTSADVSIEGSTTFKTDKDGTASISGVKPGPHSLKVGKKYYQEVTSELSVPLRGKLSQQVKIIATGRQVPVSVVNKISGQPLADVTLKASGTEVKTDKDGKATIVLPADKTDLPITISNGGYNGLEARVKVTDAQAKENIFGLVPTGKLYFLSKQSGKLDVVKTDLDGSNRQTIVSGTGKEEESNTVLLASRDWKYLALHSKRDSGLAKLYLIDTSTDKMSEMDAGDATFKLVGWDEHDFVYRVDRNRSPDQYWQANGVSIKSFSADKKQILTIDQNATEGKDDAGYYQQFGDPYIVAGKVVYSVGWVRYGSPYNNMVDLGNLRHSIRAASTNTVSKKDVIVWVGSEYYSYIQVAPYEPQGLYVGVTKVNGAKADYYEYENGAVEPADIDENTFITSYATYLQSPGGKQTFWNEVRDGKSTFFVGDQEGKNGKQLGVFEEYQVYGWYSDDYLLASKKGSELYILPVAGGTPLKVADYHKPQLSYRGYGGGYGGL